jgi:pimeloyl-ACP methyl ester carboxylesterase
VSTGRAGTLEEAGPDRRTTGRPRVARLLRRVALAGVVLLVLATAFSVTYNEVTARRATPPAGLSYVQAGDVLTRIRRWGDAGSPVLLVHGAAETADTWSPVAERLAAHHRVYALDLDGWGYSRRVAPFDLDHQTRQLLATVQALGLHRPVLVGHSSGAAIVAEAALRAPQAVGALMLLDGDALATGAGAPSPLRYLLIPPYRTTVLRLALGSDTLVRDLYQRNCGPRCPPLDAAGVEAWRRPFQVPGAEAGIWGMLDAGVPGLSIQRLSGVAAAPMPKSVVFGSQDPVFTAATPQQTAARIGAPAATLLPGGRHLTMISDPAPVAASIEALAARVPAAAG